jgi:hypothetical protein
MLPTGKEQGLSPTSIAPGNSGSLKTHTENIRLTIIEDPITIRKYSVVGSSQM